MPPLFWVVGLSIVLPYCANAATSDWLSAPQPKYPTNALKKGAEGSIDLQVMLSRDGHVRATTVLRSTGDPILDAAAQHAVSKWRMKPSAIRPSDLTRGRRMIVEFKQEALVAAVYPDRKAYFTNTKATDVWMFAPFPAYPHSVQEKYHTGKVLLKGTIGRDGRVSSVQVLQSSGHSDLNELALKAVRLWRAHKQFSGRQFTVPIDFSINWKHYY